MVSKSSIKIGDRFSRLVVQKLISDPKNPKAKCVCDCGNVVTPQSGALRNGRAKSCGCLRAEQNRSSPVTHGRSKSVEYRVFAGMQYRCNNPKSKHYKNYGGRGIQVLYDNFEHFLSDVGDRPDGCWIERLDNEKSYEPGNCVWVLPTENQINKRVSKLWLINGVQFESSVAAAQALGIDPSAVNRGCNGYTKNGKYFPPRKGWSCSLKYEESLA